MINYAKAREMAAYCEEIYRDFSIVMFQNVTDDPLLISDERGQGHEMNTDTQCAVLPNGTAITIVFRGTESSYDWQVNLDTMQERAEFDRKIIQNVIVAEESREQDYPYDGDNQSDSLIHKGFTAAYFSVRERLHDYILGHDVKSATVTGHSLGGALATLCAVDLQYNFSDRLEQIEVYTYGAPRVGNQGFSDSYNRRVPDSYRIINGMDIVPALPRWWQGRYVHVEQEVRIGSRFSFNFFRARIEDHSIASYVEELTRLAAEQ